MTRVISDWRWSWPEANRHAKDHHQAISADSLQDWAEFAAPRTFGLAVRAYAGLRLAERHPVVHNLVISNVPGPPVPLYFAGARIEAMYPLGPVFHGAGVNITVGLPVIRTSVDHGTAFDIAGKGIVEVGSMIEALRQAAEMSPSPAASPIQAARG